MKIFVRLFYLTLFTVPTLGFAQQTEQDLVRQAFNNYKSAILNDEGEKAADLVDSKTIAYYGEVLGMVKNADSVTVDRSSLMDKLMVLIIRHRIPKEEIMTIDGRRLLVTAIQMGMVGKSSVINNDIGKVAVSDRFASGELLVQGKKTPLSFEFHKEDGIWKLDLTAAFPAAQLAFRKLVEDSGQSENDFFLSIIELSSGKKPERGIWMPTKSL